MAVLSNTGIRAGAVAHAAAASSGGDTYQIERSLTFNDEDSPYLTKTPVGAGNRKTFTIATWYKFSRVKNAWYHGTGQGSADWFIIGCEDSDGNLTVKNKSSSDDMHLKTNQVFRDFSAWYHVIVAIDTTQAVESERAKIYINGKRVTSFETASYPSQNLKLAHNRGDKNYDIGRQGTWGSQYHYDGLLADYIHIDGYALSPGAFGSFDSMGVFNPTAFALPTPNDGTTWSSAGDNTNINSSYPWTKAFDGVADGTYGNGAGADDGDGWARWTPTGGITVKASLRLNTDNGTTSAVKVKFSSGTNTSVQHLKELTDGWNDVEGSGVLEYIEIYNSGSEWSYLCGVEIDGVILVDGQTDSTDRVYKNTGLKWSDFLTATNGDLEDDGHAQGPDKSFDDDESTYSQLDNSSNPNSQTFTPPGGLAYTSKVEVYINNTQNTIGINGGTQQSTSVGWNTLATGSGTINTIKVERASSNGCSFHGIRVDGQVLINEQGDNSFHLKFNDTSSNAALGNSSFGPDFTESQTAKGGPILKTNITGQTVTSGTHTDPDDSNLKLGIAGTAFSDTEGGTITASGSVISTAKSKFYGSSIFFDGSNDYVSCPSNLWAAGGNYTFEAWLYADSIASSGGNVIFHTGGSGQLCIQNNNSGYRILCHPASSNYFRSSDTIPLDEWFHLAFTQTNDTRTVFINGIKNTSYDSTAGNPQTQDWDSPTGALTLGHLSNNNRAYWDGHMQDIRVYDKIKYTDSFTPPTRRGDFTVNNLTAAVTTEVDYDSYWDPVDINMQDGGAFTGTGSASGYVQCHSSSTTSDWEPDTPISGTTFKLFIKHGVNSLLKVNGTSFTTTNNAWNDISSLCGSGLSKLELGPSGAGAVWIQLWAIEVDGVILQNQYKREIDSITDTPTNYLTTGSDDKDGGVTRGNYATLNPLAANKDDKTISQGNLKIIAGAGKWKTINGTMGMSSGKWYWEVECLGASQDHQIGISNGQVDNDDDNDAVGNNAWAWVYQGNVGKTMTNGTQVNYGNTYGEGDYVGVAFDADAGNLYFYKNGTIQNSGTAAFTGLTSGPYVPTFCPHGTSIGEVVNFGQRPFKYTNAGTNRPSADYKCLCTQNLPDSISGISPSKYFDILTYTGTAGTQTVRGLGFQPEMVWVKRRNGSSEATIMDALRGFSSTKKLCPSENNAENDTGGEITNPADGYVSGVSANSIELTHSTNGWTVNKADQTYVAWCWDAGTAAGTPIDTGGITPSAVWKNRTAGFSITQYAGSGSNHSVPHDLGAKPDLLFVKKTNAAGEWRGWHSGLDSGKGIDLNSDGTQFTDTSFTQVADNNYIYVNGSVGNVNNSGNTYMLYAWTAIPGYSAFGSWTGNQSASGPFIYTGFRPRMIMFKNISTASRDWYMLDTKRDPFNEDSSPSMQAVWANRNTQENNDSHIDILSNGFKLRTTGLNENQDGNTMVYAAFAEHPFKLARAR